MPRVKNNNLTLVTLRLLKSDLAVARKLGRARAIPYTHVLRGWVSDGAVRSQQDTNTRRRG